MDFFLGLDFGSIMCKNLLETADFKEHDKVHKSKPPLNHDWHSN